MTKEKPPFDFAKIGIVRQMEQLERFANPMGKMIRQVEMLGRLANPLGDVVGRMNKPFVEIPHVFTNHMKVIQKISGLSAISEQVKLIQDIGKPFGGISGFNALSDQMKLTQSINSIGRAQLANTKWTNYASLVLADNIRAAGLHTRGLLPNIGLDKITSALNTVASTLLGQTINTVARTFPSQSLIASEALSALAGLKLHAEFAHTGPLVSSLLTLQDAIDKSEDEADFKQVLLEAAQTILRLLEELLQSIKSKVDSVTKAKVGSVATFMTFVLAALTFRYTIVQTHYAEVQTHYAESAEQRAHQQDETTKQLNDTLSRIAELLSQAQSAKQHVDTTCFRVDRAVYVRERQDTTSFRIILLQPGAIIDVDESNRFWAHVTIDDHITGVARKGWVWKKNISTCR